MYWEINVFPYRGTVDFHVQIRGYIWSQCWRHIHIHDFDKKKIPLNVPLKDNLREVGPYERVSPSRVSRDC